MKISWRHEKQRNAKELWKLDHTAVFKREAGKYDNRSDTDMKQEIETLARKWMELDELKDKHAKTSLEYGLMVADDVRESVIRGRIKHRAPKNITEIFEKRGLLHSLIAAGRQAANPTRNHIDPADTFVRDHLNQVIESYERLEKKGEFEFLKSIISPEQYKMYKKEVGHLIKSWERLCREYQKSVTKNP